MGVFELRLIFVVGGMEGMLEAEPLSDGEEWLLGRDMQDWDCWLA
jgi:hypothetical protein